MKPYLDDGDVRLFHGDALEVLRQLPGASVDCIATSPPFFGLRDYGTGRWEGGDPGCDHAVRRDPKIESSTLAGGKGTTGHQREGFGATCPKCGATRVDQQIGLEATPDEWASRLTDVFREARRVLADHGTLWIECGDSYAASMTSDRRMLQPTGPNGRPATDRESVAGRTRTATGDCKPKDLIGSPFLLAFARRQRLGWDTWGNEALEHVDLGASA